MLHPARLLWLQHCMLGACQELGTVDVGLTVCAASHPASADGGYSVRWVWEQCTTWHQTLLAILLTARFD
jgi:hypothetical protein